MYEQSDRSRKRLCLRAETRAAYRPGGRQLTPGRPHREFSHRRPPRNHTDQSSIRKLGTRLKSRRLRVSKVSAFTNATAAIRRS
jgi:hypothetical protein